MAFGCQQAWMLSRYLHSESFLPTALTLVESQEEQVTWGTVFLIVFFIATGKV